MVLITAPAFSARERFPLTPDHEIVPANLTKTRLEFDGGTKGTIWQITRQLLMQRYAR